MKAIYEAPKSEISEFKTIDVITTSDSKTTTSNQSSGSIEDSAIQI